MSSAQALRDRDHPGTTRVTVVNGFGDGNLGGAAITLASCDFARSLGDDVELRFVKVSATATLGFNERVQPDLVVLNPPFAGRDSGLLRRAATIGESVIRLVLPRLRSADPTISALQNTDIVVAKGGYVYRERGGAKGLLAGWFTNWPYLFAKRCGATAVAFSASIGPFERNPSRWLARLVLRGSALVCPRDDDSERRLLRELRHRGSIHPMDDCVFSLAGDSRIGAAPDQRSAHDDTLCIVPREMGHRHWPGFVDICKAAIDSGRFSNVELVLQDETDRAAGQRLVTELAIDPSSIITTRSPELAIERYAAAELVISGRLHGTIFSLLAGCPVLMVEIPHETGKSEPVLERTGLGWIVVTTDQGDTCTAVLDRLLEPGFRESLSDEIADRGTDAAAIIEEISDQTRSLAG